MARPERNNVDYFPFLCKEGKALFYIEEKYGNDGFATWIKILRQLAVTNYHYLNLSDKIELMFLAAKCKVSENTLIEIITALCNLGEFDSFLWNECRIIYNQKFIDHIQDAYKKRNNECITYEGLEMILRSLGILKPIKSKSKGSVNTQSKVKNIKVEKTIEEQFSFFWNEYHSITKKQKTDKVPTFKHFKKLTLDERRKAYTMIQNYSDSNKDKQYIKKARTYLSDKCFNDEFKAVENSNIYRKNE